jgi:hypothetical protein
MNIPWKSIGSSLGTGLKYAAKNKVASGAVLGGATGAVVGGKGHRTSGALLGAGAGAGIGYGIGHRGDIPPDWPSAKTQASKGWTKAKGMWGNMRSKAESYTTSAYDASSGKGPIINGN